MPFVPLFRSFAGTMVLRVSKNIPQQIDGTRRSELGMFVAVAAQAATAAASGHGGGGLSSGMTALDVPPEPEGRQRRPYSELRAAEKERHMRRLAVALTFTRPMTAALAHSAWPPNSPPADALHAPPPRNAV